MKSFNVVTGLPRSGSTLLCNILNQNPEFHASSTSPLSQMVATLSNIWSNSPELKSDLIRDKDAAVNRMTITARAMCQGWYYEKGEQHVFDKGRGWSSNALVLKQLFPNAKIIVTVRDLRNVFASIEKQHRRNPILDHASDMKGKALFARADQMFSPEGLLGCVIAGVEDIARRKPKDVLIVQYESLGDNPQFVMDQIYARLGADPFAHDFDNVENTAEDVDGLYLDKFEHKGDGKVAAGSHHEWRDFVSPDLGDLIMGRFGFYNKTFGYTA